MSFLEATVGYCSRAKGNEETISLGVPSISILSRDPSKKKKKNDG